MLQIDMSKALAISGLVMSLLVVVGITLSPS
jgi:hypothetical protein